MRAVVELCSCATVSIICWPKGVREASVGLTFDSLKMALGLSFEMWPKSCQETPPSVQWREGGRGREGRRGREGGEERRGEERRGEERRGEERRGEERRGEERRGEERRGEERRGWEGGRVTTTTHLYSKTVGGGPNKHCQNSNQLFTPNMGGPQL